MAPEVPVRVTVEVPVGVADGTVRVSVLVEVVGFGLNPAVTPLGIPDHEWFAGKDGAHSAAAGLRLSTHSLLKIGMMMVATIMIGSVINRDRM